MGPIKTTLAFVTILTIWGIACALGLYGIYVYSFSLGYNTAKDQCLNAYKQHMYEQHQFVEPDAT